MAHQPFKRYALTGGIGSGKSTVATMFAQLGAVIIDADAISHQLMQPGEAVLAAVTEEFGTSILHPNGTLNRPALASLAFSNDNARERLNTIVHPAIREQANELVQQAVLDPSFSGIIIDDVPLLFETGRAAYFDAVVVIYSDIDTRLKRLQEIRGLSESDARARIASQATDTERASIATWVIDNNCTLESTRTQVINIWSQMRSM